MIVMRHYKVIISTLLIFMGMGGSPAIAQGSASIPIGSENFARGEVVAVPITATGCDNMTAFSFEVSLPDCVSGIDSVKPGNLLTGGHALFFNKSDDKYYVACMSFTSSLFTSGSGVLCYLYLHISDDIDTDLFRVNINNIEFSTAQAEPSHSTDSYVDVHGFFTIQTYRLEYYVDGKLDSFDSIDACSPIVPKAIPFREGYTFSGWSEIPSVMPDGDVTVTGTFNINTYRVEYKVDGVVFGYDSIAYSGNIPSLKEVPVKEGYTFVGWSEIPAVMPAGDVTVTGTFVINTYRIEYKVDEAVFGYDSIVYSGSIPSLKEVPFKEGYTFTGGSVVPATMPAHDVVVTAGFTINSYKLIYKIDNNVYKTVTLEYGSKVTAEASPAKEGYTFSGWSGVPNTMPAKDVTVTGSYTLNSYRLTLVYDGKEVFNGQIAYGMSLAQYIDILEQQGYDLTELLGYVEYVEEKYGDISNITMPAHDVTLNITPSAVKPVMTDEIVNKGLFDLRGRRVETDDLSALPKGIYILDGRKYIVK